MPTNTGSYNSRPGHAAFMSEIQTTVLGVVRRDEESLVQRLIDPGGGSFYRPIGGGIEFRETSAEALEREFREELGARVSAGPVVGTMENLFAWDGTAEHELVVLRTAAFVDESLYDRDRFDGVDAGGDVEYEATWHTLAELAAASEPLYPAGLAELLRGETGAGRGHVVSPRE
ncbi:NUDIX hydrolase [Halobacteriales archaeon QS_1_67_19]|nr:MAG: NUDIX hydrolase [Halobacteriales archaeon QS_1_67_19]